MRKYALEITLVVAWIAVIAFMAALLLHPHEKPHTHYKTVTVERSVPGPETTVKGPIRWKKQPGATTWIVVCGEQTTHYKNDDPIKECKLPDTGGQLRRHKAH